VKRADSIVLTAILVLGVPLCASAEPVSTLGGPRGGAIVFNQQPTRLGGPMADTLALDQWGYEIWQQVADNIRLSQTASIQHVNWWGFYGGQSVEPPTGDETMRIRFYAARPSDDLPGDILLEESFLNLPRTWTGHIIGDGGLPKEYLFQADLSAPITLSADTIYWLEVLQVGDPNSHFRWEQGHGVLAGSAYVNVYTPDWTPVVGSCAFQLVALPEPAGLVCLACAGLIVRRSTTGRRCRGLRNTA
jgi:hypothetical protein